MAVKSASVRIKSNNGIVLISEDIKINGSEKIRGSFLILLIIAVVTSIIK